MDEIVDQVLFFAQRQAVDSVSFMGPTAESRADAAAGDRYLNFACTVALHIRIGISGSRCLPVLERQRRGPLNPLPAHCAH